MQLGRRYNALAFFLAFFSYAQGAEKLTLPNGESGFDNPIPPMPSLLENESKKAAPTLKKHRKESPKKATLEKEDSHETQRELSNEVSKKVSAEAPELKLTPVPNFQSHEKEKSEATEHAHQTTPPSAEVRLKEDAGFKIINSLGVEPPSEPHYGWFWFGGAMLIFMALLFWLA